MSTTPPRVDGLELLQILGEGGFGRVWKARRSQRPGTIPSSSSSSSHEQLVAVKIMSKPPLENASAVQREVEIWEFLSLSASRLPSMHLMPIVQMLGLHHATSDGQQQICISMQLCNGGTLADVLPLKESEAMAVAHTLARALHMCHALGVLHLDVKPQNVLFPLPICRDARRGALLADFGLSQFLPRDASFIKRGCGAGTCGYQAPEVITDGIYSPAADAWSLGALLLEALTGHLPPHDPWGDGDNLIVEFEQWDSCDAVSPSWLDDYMGDVWNCPEWASLSLSVKDAIRGLLCPNPHLRLTLLELLNHPCLQSEELLHQSLVDAFLPPGTPTSASACAAAMSATTPALLRHHVPPTPPPGFV